MKQRTARKMHRFISMLMAVVLCAGLCGSFLAIKANAADGTVKGKVADGTTDDLLKLDTSEGIMQIKMDADLNIEDAPVLIKGKEVTVEWKYGSDSYLHTSCIKASGGTNVPVDYVPVRYVKKPNGARPGMVIFTHNQTVYVDPKIPGEHR